VPAISIAKFIYMYKCDVDGSFYNYIMYMFIFTHILIHCTSHVYMYLSAGHLTALDHMML